MNCDKNNILVDSKYGYFLPMYDKLKDCIITSSNSIYNAYNNLIKKEELGEWLRLIYVAMTRCRHAFYSVNVKTSSEEDEYHTINDLYFSKPKTLKLNKILNGINKNLEQPIFSLDLDSESISFDITDNEDTLENFDKLKNKISEFIRRFKN